MKNNAVMEILRLAFSKKKFSEKIVYLLQGIVFAIVLLFKNEKRKKDNRHADANPAGDDIYPLF